jgi:hypothetical protein
MAIPAESKAKQSKRQTDRQRTSQRHRQAQAAAGVVCSGWCVDGNSTPGRRLVVSSFPSPHAPCLYLSSNHREPGEGLAYLDTSC